MAQQVRLSQILLKATRSSGAKVKSDSAAGRSPLNTWTLRAALFGFVLAAAATTFGGRIGGQVSTEGANGSSLVAEISESRTWYDRLTPEGRSAVSSQSNSLVGQRRRLAVLQQKHTTIRLGDIDWWSMKFRELDYPKTSGSNPTQNWPTLSPGEVRDYFLSIPANHYVNFLVVQRDIDAVISLYDPAGRPVVEVSAPRIQETNKHLTYTTNQAGEYRLQIRDFQNDGGTFLLGLQVNAPNIAENRKLIEADRLSVAAWMLHETETEAAYREAIPIFEKAVSLWLELGEPYRAFEASMNYGAVLFRLSRFEEAIAVYERLIPLFANSVVGTKTETVPGWTFNELASCYLAIGESEKALQSAQRSIEEFRKNPNDHRGLAIAFTKIGSVYLALGDKQRAFENLRRAIPYWQVASAGQPETFGLARVYTRLAEIYASLGDDETALQHGRAAEGWWQKTAPRSERVTALHMLGRIHLRRGESRLAADGFADALQVARAIGNRLWQAKALTSLAQLRLETGEVIQAKELVEQASSLATEIDSPGTAAGVNLVAGRIEFQEARYPRAIALFDQSATTFRSIRDPEGEAESLYYLALAEASLGQVELAMKAVERSLALSEQLRSSFAGSEMRASYAAAVRKYYELQIDLLMRAHRANPDAGFSRRAFEASERGRARALLETLLESGADIRAGVDATLLDRARALQQKLDAKSNYRIQLLSGKRNEEVTSELEQEIKNLSNEYREVESQIRAVSPRYAGLTQPPTLTLVDIRNKVLDEDTALLEYSLGEERSFLWLLTRDDLLSFELPKRAEIESQARSFQNALSTIDTGNSRGSDAAGLLLSRMILGPAIPYLGTKRLLIVPDGALHYIPFASFPLTPASAPAASRTLTVSNKARRNQLLDEATMTRLIVNHEVVVLPSASTLALLRDETARRPLAPKLAAVFADPVFSLSDERLTKVRLLRSKAVRGETSRAMATLSFDRSLGTLGLDSGGGIPRLYSTRYEAQSIAAFAGADSTQLSLDFAASKSAVFNSGLERYQIVHFATHALANSRSPELSGIVLSLIDETGRSQNGFLQAHEIYNLKLPAELVVLSACDTALGKDMKGEGLISLTRGFMYAGARRVVSSLWQVDSKATAELMTRFYRELLVNKRPPATALRAAQVSLSRDPRWSAPYYWAGFIIQGEYQ